MMWIGAQQNAPYCGAAAAGGIGLMDVARAELAALSSKYAKMPRQYSMLFIEDGECELDDSAWQRDLELSLGRKLPAVACRKDRNHFRGACARLVESFHQANEVTAISFIASSTYGAALFAPSPLKGGDGHPLFCSEHRNVSARPLSIDALRRSEQQIIDDLGVRPRLLLVPPELEPAAIRIFAPSQQQVGTMLIDEYCVLDFLESPSAWYILTEVPGFVRKTIVPFEAAIEIDDDDQLCIRGHERSIWFCHDSRAIWGSFPEKES